MGEHNAPADVGTYELRVQGLLGPLLLSSLPHTAARRLPDHSVLITDPSDGRDLVDLMGMIVAEGLEVESVRTVTQADDVTPADHPGRTKTRSPAQADPELDPADESWVAGQERSSAMAATLLSSQDTVTAEDAARLSRLWWVPLLLGVGWLVVALAVLQFDVTSVRTISLMFGVILIGVAIHEFADTILAPGWKWVHAGLSGLFLVGGIVTLVWPDITFMALSNLIGWYLLFKGTFDVVAALSLRGRLELWGLVLATGILELVLAFWVVGYAGRSAALLILWVGLGALAKGVTSIVVGFQLRALGEEPPQTVVVTPRAGGMTAAGV
jgi:uncharacterized membrane protein HdeD (DUF308 family)